MIKSCYLKGIELGKRSDGTSDRWALSKGLTVRLTDGH